MKEEMEYSRKNETWDMVIIPNERKPVIGKWLFKKKMNEIGQVEKYKAQLVVRGYPDVKGVGLHDIFVFLIS